MIPEIEPKLEICPNIIAGENGETWFSKEKRKEHKDELRIKKKKYLGKTIVIVLESPHTKEYADKNFINPALGKTGKNLHTYFKQILDKIIKCDSSNDFSNYRIILMNSIRFQCSLGLPTEFFRDHIWLSLWINKGFKEDFIERLKSYHPDIIFNFCIQGDHSGEYELCPQKLKGCKTVINEKYIQYLGLKNPPNCLNNIKYSTTIQALVSYEISKDTLLKDKILYVGPHPSSWKKAKHGVIKIFEKDKPPIPVQLFEPKNKDKTQKNIV